MQAKTLIYGYSLMLMLGVALFLCSVAMADSLPTVEQAPGCSKPTGIPSSPLFKNLKTTQIFVDIPPRIEKALQCRGREADCAKAFSNSDTVIVRLRDDFSRFPKVLYPESLTNLLMKHVSSTVTPILLRDNSCHTAPIGKPDKRELIQAANSSDMLTIVLKMSTDDLGELTTPLSLVSLSLHFYRPGQDQSNFQNTVLLTQSIPVALSLPEHDIEKRVSHLIKHSQLRISLQNPVKQ